MKPFVLFRSFAQKFWGLFPLVLFAFLDISAIIYQYTTDTILRSIPFQLLYWGTALSCFCMLAWLLWLFFRFLQKKKTKALPIIFAVLLIVSIGITLFAGAVLSFVSVFSYAPEHVVNRDGVKMVARVTAFLDVRVDYYQYKNLFFRGSEIIESEDYGSGGFDPFEP